MIRVLELFAGIGAFSKTLARLGIEHEIVDAVEIDKFAIASFNAIHGTDFKPQDIMEWDKEVAQIDLLMHGSPCQDFSIAGKGAGGDLGTGTRSSLMYETLRIVKNLMPKYVIWENVPNILSAKHKHNFDAYLSAMEQGGYSNHYAVLNAKDFGVPQNRKRVYTVSILGGGEFEFPKAEPLMKKLADVLEDEVDEKYYLSDEQVAKFKPLSSTNNTNVIGNLDIKGKDQIRRVYSSAGLSPTLTTMGGGNQEPKIVASRGRYREDGTIEQHFEPRIDGLTNSLTTVQKDNYVAEPPLRIRKLTPKECWRLMGFDDEDYEKAAKVNSKTQLYKQAGNSIVVNVLEAIIRKLLR